MLLSRWSCHQPNCFHKEEHARNHEMIRNDVRIVMVYAHLISEYNMLGKKARLGLSKV